MTKRKHILVFLFFSLISYLAYSTHIVGGSLTYVYNGGSNYTITLKLYKDCGSGAAGFPANVTINVLGNNGQTFSPSKDITINLGTVTNVPSNLDPCAIPPNPMPCVQEGIYTKTINNLPPNAGGYHLYYQVVARNLSLTNINGACNCIGESYYAYIPGMSTNTIWNENFSLPNNTIVDNGATSWGISPGATSPNFAAVNNNMFEVRGANNASETWTSQNISIASCSTVNLSVDLSENGNLDANDSISVYYRINGGPLVPFAVNGLTANDFTSLTATSGGLSGSNVQIVIRARYDNNSPNSEVYQFDNVTVSCVANDFKQNNNAVFNQFPPLFICVNQPFTFDHSATDTNGDSLVYSLYTPYDGDAGAGPLDPTFPANTASFTPVTYLGGYTYMNPLGPTPFNLNPSTGLLTGTPGTLGQFVVGVMVKEYRNGVYLSQTLRDFQFNVLNCPQPPPSLSVPNATVNNGCVAVVHATGISTTSATWTSISPGAPGAYNGYLSCLSGCTTNTIAATGTLTPPPFIDYKVCGNSISCSGAPVCDTFRVFFNSALVVNILPSNPTICFGQTSTTITAVGSGGTPPYSYLWNNVNPSQTINVGVGNYNVQLSDASGCPPVNKSVAVTAFSVPITANAGADQIKCIQNPLAILNGTVTGATGGIWSGGTGTYTPNNTTLSNLGYMPTATEIAAGFVKLILTTTGNGTCPSKTDTVKITFQNFTGTPTPSITNVSCFGGTNGSVTMNMTGGVAPYTYTWTTVPTQTVSTVNNLPIGTYSVTIKDGIGCILQTTISITQPSPLAISSTVTNVKCSGTNTGSISVSPTGGNPGYTYSWTPTAQTASTAVGLTNGTYTVKVTDTKGCILNSTLAVTQPLPITINTSFTNVSCFNGNNGAITSSVSGGTSPYTYSWSPGSSTSPSPSGLTAGNYTLTVTDNNACAATVTVSISQPALLTVLTAVQNETCDYLNNGSITTTVTGGTSGYTYVWQPGGQTTSNISSLSSASYTVLVTDSKSCTATAAAVVTQPTALTVNFSSQNNISCFGGNNGNVTASASGGTPNYVYSWSPIGGSGATASNLPVGTYTVSVTDSKTCLITNTVSIIQPVDIAVTATTSNVSCNGGTNGTISTSVIGGTAPYTYFWSVGAQSTPSVSGLSAGTYTLIVTDANGCQKIMTYTITQPTPISIAFTATNVSCYNGNNASITPTVSGGTSSYTYSWSPSGLTTPNLNSLPIGNYTLFVTDANLCLASSSMSITQPSSLTLQVNSVNATCNYLNNGSATVTATGGTGPYSYLWQPGGQTTATVTGLSSGVYTVMVTDSKACTSSSVIAISQPAPLSIAFGNQINVSCFGGNNGSIGATAIGGTPNYSYSWLPSGATTSSLFNIPAGTYTLTITDNNSCVLQNTVAISQPAMALSVSCSAASVTCNGGSNGVVTSAASGGTSPYSYQLNPGGTIGAVVPNLSAGIYTATVTDFNGCVTTNTVNVSQPGAILPITSGTNSTCGNANGKASVTVSGGISPYTYSWTPSSATTTLVTGLLAGIYTITVTDANNCQGSQYLIINDIGGPTASISSSGNVSCFGGNDGTATATITGGVSPFTYTWSPTGGNGLTASNLIAGTYFLTVEDANGCISIAVTNPSITEPTIISSSITATNVSCFGGTNGTATITATGGTPNYTYTWLPSLTTGSIVTGLSAGIYSVQVKDTKNCIHTNTFAISQPTAALNQSITSTSVSCFNGTNGTASVSVNGGTFPYNHIWNPGNISGQAISNMPAGTYSVTSVDIKGCTITNTASIIQPTSIALVLNSNNSNCGAANGQATVTASGGMGSYNYTWSPAGGNNNTASGLLSGIYSVSVNDINGCVKINTVNVGNNPGPSVSVSGTSSVSCFGGANGTATASVVGGTGPFTYTWSPSGGNASIASGLPIGTYTVAITSANGCTNSAVSSAISQPSQIALNISTSNVSCFSGSNGSATVTAFGGVPAYTYTWLPGASTGSTVTGLSLNTYSLQAKDLNNCIQTSTFSISQPTAALSSSVSFTAVSCFGGANGICVAQASGGTPPYNYNWLPVNTNSAAVTGLSAGTYTVSITDSKGCLTTNTVTVTQPTLALTATGNGSPTFCFGGSNGSATVTPVGGTPGYSYTWTPSGGNNQSASGLTPGNYNVLVNDAKGCQTNVGVIISQPTAVTVSLTPYHAACGVANGSITSQVSGGTGPYSYTWSPVASNNSILLGILPGSYTLQVADSYGCIAALTSSVINIPGPTTSLVSTANVSCFNGNNGAAQISITSGTAPYSINWLPYGGNSTTASSLIAGSYTANVTDSRGCLVPLVADISEPSGFSLSISSVTNVSCFNGTNGAALVNGNGGVPGYTYSWVPTGQTGASASNLPAGTYTVNASDLNSCPAIITVVVSQPSPLTSTISGLTNPSCFNGIGSATVIASGGTIPYNYLWSTNPPQFSNTANNMSSGNYTVAITDANNCSAFNTFTLTQPSQVITSAGLNDTICLGQTGALQAFASGGAGNYYYTWQPAGVTNNGTYTISPTINSSYTVVAFDQNGCAGNPDTLRAIVYSLTSANVQTYGLSPICPGQSSLIYTQVTGNNTGPISYSWNNGLGNTAGTFIVSPSQPTTYVVTVSNSCGATVIDSAQVLFNPPPTMSVSVNATLVCLPATLNFNDNSITGNINDPITTWNWDFGDGETATGQNPSHEYTTPGTYSITVSVITDAGCSNTNSSAPIVVSAQPSPNASFALNPSPPQVLNLPYDVLYCTNTSTGATTYVWNFGDGNTSTLINPNHLYEEVGEYTVELVAISDYGCTDTARAVVITDADLVFPNAFTPLEGGATSGYYDPNALDNNVFHPYHSGVIDYKLQIFNRWGELIFESFDVKQGWDGYYREKLCQVGVYVWKAYAKLNNGKVFNKSGDVTLLK